MLTLKEQLFAGGSSKSQKTNTFSSELFRKISINKRKIE